MNRNRYLAFYVDMIGIRGRLFGEQTRMLETLSLLGKNAGIDVVVLVPGYIELKSGWRYLPNQKTWVKVQVGEPSIVIRRSGTFSPNKRIQARQDLVYFAKHKLLHTLPFACSNKWKLYRVLYENPLIRPFLPYTQFANSPKQLYEVMHARKDVYVKPITGAQGICIYRFVRESQNVIRAVWEERIIPRDMERRTVKFQPETRLQEEKFSGEREFERFWQKTGLRQCIVQDTVFLQRDEEGRPFDFRWLVQSSDSPEIIARVARVGKQDGVTTNIHTGGTAMEVEKVLQRFSKKDQQAFILQMDDVADKVVAQLVCQYGHFAEVGIDLAVDMFDRIFVFEVNPTPGRRMLRALSPTHREMSLQALIEYASRAIESNDS